MGFTRPAVERAMKMQEVILKAMSGQYTWLQAAEILGVTPRCIRRWRARYEAKGYDGLFDRRRRTPSPRRAPFAEVQRILRLYRERYEKFNVRHFHGIARREHGVRLSYTYVKQLLQGAGLVRKYRPRGRHRRRREPRACFGEMLHLDGSPHAWLALLPAARQVLIAVLDDATSRLLYAQLCEAESSWSVMLGMHTVIRQCGIPGSWYTDRAGWAVYTPKAGGPYDPERLTQVGRALKRLGSEHILAYSPQARGRGERLNRTLQDRLVNELRLARISTLPAANRYLRDRFIPAYNREFAHPPRDRQSAFVPLGRVDLDQILCHEEERTVAQDNTVILEGVRLQISKQPGRRSCAGLRVLIRRHLDGTHSIWWGTRCFGRFTAQGQPRTSRPVEAAGSVDAGQRAPRPLDACWTPQAPTASTRPPLPALSH